MQTSPRAQGNNRQTGRNVYIRIRLPRTDSAIVAHATFRRGQRHANCRNRRYDPMNPMGENHLFCSPVPRPPQTRRTAGRLIQGVNPTDFTNADSSGPKNAWMYRPCVRTSVIVFRGRMRFALFENPFPRRQQMLRFLMALSIACMLSGCGDDAKDKTDDKSAAHSETAPGLVQFDGLATDDA